MTNGSNFEWYGTRRVAFVLANVTNDPRFPVPPTDWRAQVVRRVQALRDYFWIVSVEDARLEAEVFGPYTVQFGGNRCRATAVSAMRAAHSAIAQFPYACVVFTGGPCDGWAFWGYGPGGVYPGSTVRGYSYVNTQASLGTWAMENLHVVTTFGDLYGISDHPGRFDIMACNCGTFPSSFTRIKFGWSSPGQIVQPNSHLQTRLRQLTLAFPDGVVPSVHTIKAVTASAQRYYLVELRRRENYDAPSGTSSGIPSEGVVVYWIDESSWPPVHLRTTTALSTGQSFAEGRFRVVVDSQDGTGANVRIWGA